MAVATLAARNLEAVGGGSPPGIPRAAFARPPRETPRARRTRTLCARGFAPRRWRRSRVSIASRRRNRTPSRRRTTPTRRATSTRRVARRSFARARTPNVVPWTPRSPRTPRFSSTWRNRPATSPRPRPTFRFARRRRGGTRDSRRGAIHPPTRRRSRWTTPSPTFASSRSVSDWTTRSRTPTSFETCITPRRARWRGRFSRRRRRDWRGATREAPARFWTRRRRSAARTRATRTRGHTRASRYSARTSRDASRSETDATPRKIVLRRSPRRRRWPRRRRGRGPRTPRTIATRCVCARRRRRPRSPRGRPRRRERRGRRGRRGRRAEGTKRPGTRPTSPPTPPRLIVSRSIRGVRSRRASRVFLSRRAHRRGGDERVRARGGVIVRGMARARPRRRGGGGSRARRVARKIPKRRRERNATTPRGVRARVRSPRIGRRRRRRRRVRRERREDARRARRVVRLVPRDVLRGDAPDGAGGDVGRFAAPGIRGDAVVRASQRAGVGVEKNYERARGYESSDWCISW